jgi:ribosomal protein S18 acetylase RimI-like enzyme
MMIRAAQEQDIEQLIVFLQELFSIEEDFIFNSTRQKKGLQLLLQHPTSTIFVAEQDGQLVGMVTGQLTISTAEGTIALLIEDLFVAVPYRKKKIATSLLQELGSWAFKNGASRMQLLADKNNESALKFYHKDGWQSTQLVCLRKYHKE